ncbi:MAG TPA: thioredoxin-like domain-containing protein [Planctomycetaceae bacterium]
MNHAKQTGELFTMATPAAGRLAAMFQRLSLICFIALLGSIGALVIAAPPADKPKKTPESKPASEPAKSNAKNPSTATGEAATPDDNDNAAEKENREVPQNPFPNRRKAPDLDGGNGWLNTAGEISLKDLRGKVVLLDFWTFCCINCMHVLPDLAYLEKKYDKQLVVIGVHSAKFSNEKETENIRRAIMRYEISHPVINDSDMTLWRKFGVSSWPSLVLIDPEGYYCGTAPGEGNRELLDKVIEKVVAYHKFKRTLDETPVRFDLEREKAKDTPLKFPGKVLADENGQRLFISDSNHNRIVVASLDGRLLETIGSGAIGKADGSYEKANFDHPQGMAIVGDKLYVADTENHMIREVDLIQKTVRTFAGTGQQGQDRRIGGDLLKTALNSPWDLVQVDGKLYVAMAGPHQIWMLDLKKHVISPFAGSGREDILNGPLAQAAMAQPSGITTDGEFLYVVDSEGSAVRRVSLGGDGQVSTVVGASDLAHGQSLFAFGDRDGVGSEARLQHPLGITWSAGQLYVADSYNHKIKRVDPKENSAATFLGDGQSGDRLDPPRFSEPAGLSVAGDNLYVADTNNHQIRKVDLRTGRVESLPIAGLAPPTPVKPTDTDGGDGRKPIRIAAQQIAAGDRLTFEAALSIPEGYKLNKLAPLTYRVNAAREQALVAADELGQRNAIEPPEAADQIVKFDVPLAARSGKGELQVTLSYGYCREGSGGLCKLGTLSWLVPVEVSADAKQTVIRLAAE